MNVLVFLYGLFFSLPLTFLDVLPYGLKIDDVILILLLLSFFIKAIYLNGNLFINKYSLLFILITITAATLAFFKSSLKYDHYFGDSALTVYSRIIQSILIILMLSFIKDNKFYIRNIKNGIVCGTSISLLVFLVFFIMHLDLSKFSYRGVYFTKDIFQYSNYLPFSIHVNTLSSFFLISFFILFFELKKYNYLCFLFLLPSFLLIGKGDIIAITAFFSILITARFNNRLLFFTCALILLVVLTPHLYSEYQALYQYRVYSSGRNELYTSALHEILNNPFGYGLGSQNNTLFSLTGINYPAHNIFLSLSLEFGLYYSLIMIFLLIYWFLMAVDKYDKYVLLSFLTIGIFGNAMYFYKYHTLAIIFCLYGLWRISINENINYSK